jgi:P27 family predicted phage terminase small subunit
VKAARGTLRPDRRRRAAAATAGNWPPLDGTPPDWLPADAATVYRRVVALLGGTLTAGDEFALSRYASLLCHWRRCNRQLAVEGLTLTTKPLSGPAVEKPHPAARLLTAIAAELRAMEDRFGLSPTSRNKLAPAEPPTEADQAETKFFPSVIPLPNGA